MNFREGSLLLYLRFKVMQNQHRDYGREYSVWKWQRSSVALQNADICFVETCAEPCGKIVVVFQACDASCAAAQFLRGRTGPRAQLQHILAK